MTKAIYRREYEIFLALIKTKRASAGLTQTECSAALGRPQSFMSDVERGSRRLDIIQIHDLCTVFGCDFVAFMRELDEAIATLSGKRIDHAE
ncbi:helix-turn-helix transcriptional regulator [Pseudomonas sp. 43(2021)]|uniref:helix-turn-helix domain-containing protein n=1 Tax=Pseudomonas sp. 43(2021) TaxID=2813560 RepID=UPI001A9F5DFF|nr:helix-turn-helix transcriptional regulator [Pseudomonas sp. 43(2021)]